jgi:hypothetical protein
MDVFRLGKIVFDTFIENWLSWIDSKNILTDSSVIAKVISCLSILSNGNWRIKRELSTYGSIKIRLSSNWNKWLNIR